MGSYILRIKQHNSCKLCRLKYVIDRNELLYSRNSDQKNMNHASTTFWQLLSGCFFISVLIMSQDCLDDPALIGLWLRVSITLLHGRGCYREGSSELNSAFLPFKVIIPTSNVLARTIISKQFPSLNGSYRFSLMLDAVQSYLNHDNCLLGQS